MCLIKFCINFKYLVYIVCVDVMYFINCMDDGFCDYEFQVGDIVVMCCYELEMDYCYCQVLFVLVFIYEGKVWVYKCIEKGGEKGLYN